MPAVKYINYFSSVYEKQILQLTEFLEKQILCFLLTEEKYADETTSNITR